MSTLVNTVPFIYIGNPLLPADSRTTVHQAYDAEKSLASYLGPLEGEWAVSISGRIVEKEDWADALLLPNDCVVVCPMVYGGGKEGGGGAKMVLRLVALVAVTYFTAGAGAGLAGAMGVTSAAGIAAVTIGVGIAATMAVNALLPPPTPKTPSSGSDYDSSPTYGIDGPKNMSTRGIPVPVVYGNAWFAGNFLQSYIDNVGDEQYLNLMINVGEGPIENITDIMINDQPAGNFSNIQMWIRTGTENQEIIPYFDDIIVAVNRQVTLKAGVYMMHDVVNPVDRLRVDVVLPSGTSRLDEKKGMKDHTTVFILQYREVGGQWLGIEGGTIAIGGRQMSAIRRSYYTPTLDRSKRYQVRATHTESTDDSNIQNAVVVTDINEITFDDINYKHTALLAMRIKLDDQLNGIPSVKYRCVGRKVPIYNALTGTYVETWTDNPAWIALDVLMNKRYGGNIPATRIKLDYFRQWAQFCTDNALKFNGVIDQRTNLWDALTPICKLGRAQIVRAGTRFQVAMVRKTKPVQLFSMGNIKKGSLSLDWMAADERANECHVTYYDKEDQGKQKTVIVPNMAARERGEEPRPTEVTLYGIDNVTQATKEGTFAMNMQQLLQTISFEAPVESIACTLGDVVAIQHDMPNWGEGGLTDTGSTKSLLKLDKPVTMETGAQYVVKVRHDQVVQGAYEVDVIVGNIVVPSFGFNVTAYDRYRRLFVPGRGADYEIEEPVIDQFGRHGLRLSSTAGLVVGEMFQLIDTNVLETRNVAAFSGSVSQLVPTVPFSAIPRAESPWAFGPTESVTQMLTVMNIGHKDDLWRSISGIEYKDSAYDDTVIDYKPDPINTTPAIPNVTFGGFHEFRYLTGAEYLSDIEMKWSSPSLSYAYAEVHIRIDDEQWQLVAENATIYTLRALRSGRIQLKLVPVTVEGFKPNFLSVTTQEYVVAPGVPAKPPSPLDVRVGAVTANVIEIKWGSLDAWSAAQNVYRYEVWRAHGENAPIQNAVKIAMTGNDHYPDQAVEMESWYTYWIRTFNTQGDELDHSDFAPPVGLSVKSGRFTSAELFPGGISLTDLDEYLQNETVDKTRLENVAGLIDGVSVRAEKALADGATEVYNRTIDTGGVRTEMSQKIAELRTADEALATSIESISVTINEDLSAAIVAERTARVTEDEAIAVSVDTVAASFGDEIEAAVTSEQVARTTKEEAFAAELVSTKAQLSADIAAAVLVETQARATETGSIASQVTELGSTLGGMNTKITQQIETTDGLKAQYTVKINNNGHIVGFGLASESTAGGGNVSEFTVVADRFKVVKPGSTAIVPIFVVDTATNRVIISNAVIGDMQSDNYIAGVSGWCLKK